MLSELISRVPEKTIPEMQEFKVDIAPSLQGPFVFYKNLLPCPREFILFEDFFIRGPSTEGAMNVFIQYVAGDLLRMQKSKRFISISEH